VIGHKKPKKNNAIIQKNLLPLSSLNETINSDETSIRVFITAVENNPSSIFITDSEGTIHYVNKKFIETTGYSSEEVLGQNPRILKSGHQSEEEYANLWNTIKSGKAWQGKFYNRKKNGELFWESITVTPVKNENGLITHFVAIKEDATQRKEAEDALERERRLLRTVIDTIPDQVFVHDRECKFVLNNLSDAHIIGVEDPAELIGKSDLDYYPPELALEFQANDREVMETGKPVIVEDEPSIMRNGQRRWVSVIKVPLFDNQKNVIGLAGVARDVTKRKMAEDELYKARQMLQLVVDNIPMLVFWKNSESQYLGCNKEFATSVGFSTAEEIVGKTDFDLSWKKMAKEIQEDDQQIIKNNIAKIGFIESTAQPGGGTVWTSTNKIPLHDRTGNVIGLLVTTENITERRMAEEEIQIANEKLIAWVNDLEIRNQEANLVRQMGDLLQVSNEREEYFTIIKEYVPQLFPNTSGALFILNNSQASLTAVNVWGDSLQSENSFSPGECWAIRRSQIYQGNHTKPGLHCKHIKQPFVGRYLEVPLVASGETIGILHIEDQHETLEIEKIQDLAHTLADHLSLSFSNLKLRETLRSQSIRDALTGLFNRRYMEESLAREIPRALRKNSTVGIIMLDIDHFKDFNDTNGHEAGDVVLREIGALLPAQVRGEDICCRYGGEEFILILPEASLDVTVRRAEQIRQAIKTMRVEYRRRPLGVVSVSLGVALFPEHSASVEGILKKADEALYYAKHNGRDRVEVTR